ncbi:hypothetical protein SELMODRAFT_422455 [Selaginella moellendorffii]|uniref:Uncharacterized protein n=1 Tax=Selaginella moellendorffii TaxID=88036 RepID=D8SIG1_SELML|nr:hypothetical protein SELMODRAFT_422455 [Selaginella moellendorffii]
MENTAFLASVLSLPVERKISEHKDSTVAAWMSKPHTCIRSNITQQSTSNSFKGDKYAILYAITDDMDRFSEEIRTVRNIFVFSPRAIDQSLVRTDPEIPVNAFYAKIYLNIRWQLVSCKHGFQSQQLVSCAPLPTEKSYLSIYADEFSSKLSWISTRAEPVLSHIRNLDFSNLIRGYPVIHKDYSRKRSELPPKLFRKRKCSQKMDLLKTTQKTAMVPRKDVQRAATQGLKYLDVYQQEGQSRKHSARLSFDYLSLQDGAGVCLPVSEPFLSQIASCLVESRLHMAMGVTYQPASTVRSPARGNSLLSTFEASKIGKDRQLTGWRRVGVFDRFKEV